MDDFAANFSGQIPVFDLRKVDRSVFKEPIAVALERTNMIGVLMRDKDMIYLSGIDIQPAHLFSQTIIVVTRVDHDRNAVFRVKENIGYPFPDTGDMLIDPPGVERLEDAPAPEHEAHGLSLIIRGFFRHGVSLINLHNNFMVNTN